MPKSFDWYRGKIAKMMTNDSDSYEIFYEVDKMYHGKITLPQQLQDFDDVRIIKDSSPHDALYNAMVALANSRIRLDVTPLGDAASPFCASFTPPRTRSGQSRCWARVSPVTSRILRTSRPGPMPGALGSKPKRWPSNWKPSLERYVNRTRS